jgi:hypothetical protein
VARLGLLCLTVVWKRKATADLSTPLRSGRDDKSGVTRRLAAGKSAPDKGKSDGSIESRRKGHPEWVAFSLAV